MSIAALKKNRDSVLAKLKDATKSSESSGSRNDDRFWAPFFDKERGTGGAVIRFLPAPSGEDLPWAKVFSHAFKGPTGKWYIENSLSTNGKTDAVGSMNSRLWNSGVESDKDVARGMKRKTSYYSNVLVIKDPANPDNEGKVFLYKYGPMIFEMLSTLMFPAADDVDAKEPVNPFDAWEGCDFVIKIVGKKIGKDLVPNYEKSYFKDCSSIGDDDEIERIWMQTHSLTAFTDPKNFKTPEELAKKLFEVLGPTVGSGVPVLEGVEVPVAQTRATPAPRARVQEQSDDDDDRPTTSSNSDEDEGLAWLRDMAQ